MINENVITPSEYLDICPIADKDFHNAMSILVEEPLFQRIVGMALPNYKYSELKYVLLSLNTKHEFQVRVMRPFLEGLIAKTTRGLTMSGMEENCDPDVPNMFITNHRDIILDSAQLGYLLLKAFIVKRNLGRIQTLQAAIQLSGYMHFSLTQKHESIWISQREGRCKDSNDRTQESLIKMLSYGNRDKSIVESLKELNIAPVAISYEYDPSDYLKAKEFLMKDKNPNWKKSPDDDLLSMRTGLMGQKGLVHYTFTPCINDDLDKIPEDLDKMLTVNRICHIIDRSIHLGYKIFKTNYIAHDILFDNKDFADKYSPEDKVAFTQYLSDQIDKVDIKLSEFDRYYMFNKMLQMYSNPLTNQLEAMK